MCDIDIQKFIKQDYKPFNDYILQNIKTKVCDFFGIEINDLYLRTKKYENCFPRFLIFAYIYKNFDVSLSFVARIFNKTHSTVLNGLKKVSNEKQLQNYYKTLFEENFEYKPKNK